MVDFIHLPELRYHKDKETDMWVLEVDISYKSPRYGKCVFVERGTYSDGATGAFDIHSRAWWVHDELCKTGEWEDRTPCTNWEASSVLADILRDESRYLRSIGWWFATWLFGCEKARKNGMWPWS